MSKSLKGTKTAKNLLKSFAGESQARNRYTFYASKAKKQGFLQISDIFLETARNEKEHAERFYKFLKEDLQGETIEITDSYPISLSDNTQDNLKAAASGENEEWSNLYPECAKVAREEGFDEIAVAFEMIAKAEEAHEKRFLKLLENVENGTVFEKDGKVFWKCGNCGYIHEGTSAPKVCPACEHPRDYFELFVENY